MDVVSDGWVIKESFYLLNLGNLFFKIQNIPDQKRFMTVSKGALFRFVGIPYVHLWIRTQTNSECTNMQQFECKMKLEAECEAQCRVLYGLEELIVLDWHRLQCYWQIFKNCKYNKVLDVEQLIQHSTVAMVPQTVNCKDCALLMKIIVAGDLNLLMDEFTEWDRFETAVTVMEAMGINPVVWSFGVADKWFRARMKKSLTGLQEMDTVPGSCKSHVLRETIANAVQEIQDTVTFTLKGFGASLDNGNPHMIPGTKLLCAWIVTGCVSITVEHGNIVFREIGGPALMKCIELCNPKNIFEFSKYFNVRYAGEKLLTHMSNGHMMSDYVYQVWLSIWDKFGSQFVKMKPSMGDIWLRFTMIHMLKVLYHLCVRDKNFDKFVQAVSSLLKTNSLSFWDLQRLLECCVDVDIKQGCIANFKNKNSCIWNVARAMFGAVGGDHLWSIKNLAFVSKYIQWLYETLEHSEKSVAQELVTIIGSVKFGMHRFKITCQIFNYYIQVHRKPIDSMLIQVFKQELPVEGWVFAK